MTGKNSVPNIFEVKYCEAFDIKVYYLHCVVDESTSMSFSNCICRDFQNSTHHLAF